MKRLMILLAVVAVAGFAAVAQQLRRPAALKPGDKVAIISPGSACRASYIDGARRVLKQWGYVPVVYDNTYGKHGSFAGTIAQRRADLEAALTDPQVKAILCSRGGYGSVQILCEMDLQLIARNPKWIIGFSDITSMHGAFTSMGVMSIHGPMGEHLTKFNGADSCSRALRGILAGRMPHYKVKPDRRNHHGTASGILLGGNLALLTSFIASPIDMLDKYTHGGDVILFIEDCDETLERFNRYMYTLKVNGTLERVKGIVVGTFSNVRYTSDFPHAYDMVESIVKEYKIPIAYGFPTGHTDANYPMVEGARVTLKVDASGAELTF